MIRFVIRRKMLDRGSGLASEGLETIDCDVPELQRILMGGGTDQDAYDYRELAGAEVLPADTPTTARLRSALEMVKEQAHDQRGLDFNLSTAQWAIVHAALRA